MTANTSPPETSAIDTAAESAVRDAIAAIVQNGQRPYSLNVPLAAQSILVAAGAGTVTRAEATIRIRNAIVAMVERGDLEAYVEGYKDWKLTR